MTEKPSGSPIAHDRAFGQVMAVTLLGIAVIRSAWVGAIVWWLIGIALLFLIVSFLVPSWLKPVRIVWMRLAKSLGVVNSRILMFLVFAVIITPIALLLRSLGKRPFSLAAKLEQESYWRVRRMEEFSPERMERQF